MPARNRTRRLTLATAIVAAVLSPLAAPGWAATGEVLLASINEGGIKANSPVGSIGVSGDGVRVVFSTAATNLDPADTDRKSDIYVKDLATGSVVLASTSDTGVKGNADSVAAALSADGTSVAFQSKATNLDPADTSDDYDVYVKNLVTGNLVLASTAANGVKGNRTSELPDLSADGTVVAFSSHANNLDPVDPDTTVDVYVKNVVTGDIAVVSTSDEGVKGNDRSDGVDLSADGGTVAFTSFATNLDPSDPGGGEDLYLKNLATGDILRPDASDTGVQANSGSYGASLSADGRIVVFRTNATNLDPADNDTTADVYAKNLDTGDLTLASTSDTGVKSNEQSYGAVLSDDGSTVTFVSFATNLDPADTDAGNDVYAKRLTTGQLALVSATETGVKANNFSLSASPSADGRAVAFTSQATNLDPRDRDGSTDAYVKQLAWTVAVADVGDRSVSEGGRTALTFTVTLSEPSPSTVRIAYSTVDGTARSGSDYAATSGTVSFAPGQVRRGVTVQILGDSIAEPDEVFGVRLSTRSPAVVIGDGLAVGLIRDDD